MAMASSRRSPRWPPCRRSAARTRAFVMIVEGCEESGSPHLMHYVQQARCAHWHAGAGALPRLGLRELRPAVDDVVAARPDRRHAACRHSARRHSLGQHWRGGVVVSHSAPPARSARERRHGRDHCARLLQRRADRVRRRRQARRAGARRRRVARGAARRRRAPDQRRQRRADSEPHVATAARHHRRRRHSGR
jgi:hypothetical protein